MKHSPTWWWTTGLLIAVILASAPGASAQTVRNGSIAGSVKDDTGASLPGVTVTVTSPALQVAQLTRVSDDKGEYQFVDLPLGTYRMAFELSGFTKLVREGITLTTGFAARVDASLRIATMEETVTVSGASPVVDVTNTRGGATLTNELLETIPNNRTYNDIMALTPAEKQRRYRERQSTRAQTNLETIERTLLEQAARCEQLSIEQRVALADQLADAAKQLLWRAHKLAELARKVRPPGWVPPGAL